MVIWTNRQSDLKLKICVDDIKKTLVVPVCFKISDGCCSSYGRNKTTAMSVMSAIVGSCAKPALVCHKRWLKRTFISYSFKHTFHATVFLYIIYMFICILDNVWPILCWCTVKPTRTKVCFKLEINRFKIYFYMQYRNVRCFGHIYNFRLYMLSVVVFLVS